MFKLHNYNNKYSKHKQTQESVHLGFWKAMAGVETGTEPVHHSTNIQTQKYIKMLITITRMWKGGFFWLVYQEEKQPKFRRKEIFIMLLELFVFLFLPLNSKLPHVCLLPVSENSALRSSMNLPVHSSPVQNFSCSRCWPVNKAFQADKRECWRV